jgi:very-short-patch-repair endonuclease
LIFLPVQDWGRTTVLFFPNPAAILGQTNNRRREPDFLICQRGKWGILELNGNSYHQSAAKDYKRADDFVEYGLKFLKFYDAGDDPEETVDHFLKRLDEF